MPESKTAGHPDWMRVIGGNEPVLLDGRHAWAVASGSVGIFHCTPDDGVSAGTRRCLLTLSSGDPILWLPANGAGGSLAIVAMERSELRRRPMTEQIAALARGEPGAVEDLQRWTAILARTMGASADRLPCIESRGTLSPEAVTRHLETLQAAFLAGVDRDHREREEARRRQFQQRERLNTSVAEHTVAELAAAADPTAARTEVAWSEPSLPAVVRRVGDVQDIAIRTPSAATPTRHPLESILDASGIRGRRVRLTGRWWERDVAPLVAEIADSGEPVAILPAARRWWSRPTYRIVSSAGTSTPVDETTAAALSPAAHVLYPSLPDRSSAFGVLKFALSSHRREIAFALLAGLLATLLGMLTPQATKIVFEQAVPDADRVLLAQIALVLVMAAAGAVLFDLAQAIGVARLSASAGARAQTGLWDHLLRLSPSFFRRFTAGDIENRVNATTEIRFLLDETTVKVLLASVVSLLYFALLFYYSGRLALMAMVIAAVAVVVNGVAGYVMSRIVHPLEELDGQLRGLVVQLISAVPKLRTAGAETRAYAQWGHMYARKQKLALALQAQSDRVQVFGVVLLPLSTAILFWTAFAETFAEPATLTLGSFLAFSAAFGTFLASATLLGNSSDLLLRVAAVWKRVTPILEAEPEYDPQSDSPGVLAGRVRMEHVSFRYREKGPLTLDDVTIEAAAGECVAIVGPSGSGKSTLINLLLRFEVPLAGAVYYDEHDLNSLDVLAVRRQLGVVTQENRILAGSIYENIVCGSLASIEDAWAAARAAGFDEEIGQLGMGMHTFISEGGGNISGGQRQRLLLARALVQAPRIIILDEATSALDNRTQAIVMESLHKLRVTRIIVAHRMSTIRAADRIYVLQAGRVVQQGTFDELLRQQGLFAQLMERQIASGA